MYIEEINIHNIYKLIINYIEDPKIYNFKLSWIIIRILSNFCLTCEKFKDEWNARNTQEYIQY